MVDKAFTVLDFLDLDLKGHDQLFLKCIAGRRGLGREITVPEINRPGLALSGFYECFAARRLQIFGAGESAYLQKLINEKNTAAIEKFFSFDVPCIVFCQDICPAPEFLEIAEKAGCPVLQTELNASDFSKRIVRIFSLIFAPKKTQHGVLIEVYGVGILLIGHAGVGKSECALELVERGHRLVADDIINLKCVNGNTIVGQGANTFISHHMEIRGLGIINVSQLYGVGSIREQKEVQLIIHLEEWDQTKVYDRIGNDGKAEDVLGVKLPRLDIPVKPGRNLPIIIEAAAMNERLKAMGYNSALDFNQNVLKWIETGEAQTAYYGSDDSY